MPAGDPERVRSLVQELDTAVPREGMVVVKSWWFDEDEHQMTVTANQAGYLRLGIEFLKAALAPARTVGRPDAPLHGVDLDLGYLTGPDGCGISFERREDVTRPKAPDAAQPPPGFVRRALLPALGPVVGALFVVVLAVGVFTILRWLFWLMV